MALGFDKSSANSYYDTDDLSAFEEYEYVNLRMDQARDWLCDSVDYEFSFEDDEDITLQRLDHLVLAVHEVFEYTDDAINSFLTAHPDVCEALLKSMPLVAQVFGDKARLNLVLVEDPEGRRYDRLIAFVYLPTDVSDAVAKLSEFRRFWHHLHDRAKDKLSFNVRVD